MCKIIRTEWSRLDSRLVQGLLKDFPKCGIKYTGKYGKGLVIARKQNDITLAKIYEKAKAANPEVSYFFWIPEQIEKAVGL